jgi:single-stranded DNA-binding protein
VVAKQLIGRKERPLRLSLKDGKGANMNDINTITVSGRVANVALRGEESKFLTFTLANHYDVRNGDEREERTRFIDCKVSSSNWAQSLAEYLENGIEVVITGRLCVRQFETKDGRQGVRLYVGVDELVFMRPVRSEALQSKALKEDSIAA